MLLTKDGFINCLKAIIKDLEGDDSFEGRLQYSFIADGVPRDRVEVVAVWRHGNSMGQGGMSVLAPTEGIELP